MKKHRKCDTAKHRRRMKKQRENRAVHQQKHILTEAYLKGPAEVREPGSSLFGPKPPAVICPLCRKPITVDDAVTKNMETITLNKKPVQVHRTCPTEKE
jgi:hypothetical protein